MHQVEDDLHEDHTVHARFFLWDDLRFAGKLEILCHGGEPTVYSAKMTLWRMMEIEGRPAFWAGRTDEQHEEFTRDLRVAMPMVQMFSPAPSLLRVAPMSGAMIFANPQQTIETLGAVLRSQLFLNRMHDYEDVALDNVDQVVAGAAGLYGTWLRENAIAVRLHQENILLKSAGAPAVKQAQDDAAAAAEKGVDLLKVEPKGGVN